MSELKKAVIRLAHEKPELRAHLIPLLKEAQATVTNELPVKFVMDVLKAVGEHFKRKHGLTYKIDPRTGVFNDPGLDVWDPNDEPSYGSTLYVAPHDSDKGGWVIGITTGGGRSFMSGADGGVQEIIREATRYAKRESDLL